MLRGCTYYVSVRKIDYKMCIAGICIKCVFSSIDDLCRRIQNTQLPRLIHTIKLISQNNY